MKDEKKTKFENNSHSIPEFMGNKSLLLFTECDSCNNFFNKNYESHLAFYLGFERSALGISGKNGVPEFKHVSDKLFIRNEKNEIVIGIDPESDYVKIDPIRKIVSFSLPKNPFVPYSVYKSFVKIAFSFLPFDKCANLKSTQVFLKSKLKTIEGREVNSTLLKYTIKNHFKKMFIRIYENQIKEKTNRPKYIAILGYNDKVFQFHIPNKELDDIDQPFIMNCIQIFDEAYDIEEINFNSTNLKRDEVENFTFKYEDLDSSKMETDFFKSLLKKKNVD
ncbi:hypothetical protein [Leptospira yasudae]|uniref:Uncharacterized protein n=1 Tax=Leptospira yasudae TaxID=2202201 RepID=A0A6N4QYF6_9LEPT|nr:hypothetical protein [Leptospira yasudae]TGL80877.1 hypothetical protein EHQ72_06615 [Leptospira yasudae]TGL88053.1 hypothetical protein EHQ83_03625 [Leptospira yasudae]